MPKCDLCEKEMEQISQEDVSEMLMELDKNFPGVPIEECALLCDDCYNVIRNN